jgi:catechol 2,3-dioxygenase-like lactoylglutathione lyase family enzyme
MPVVRRVVPDLETRDPEQSRAFYADLLGLEVAMDLGWVVTLRSTVVPGAQLTLMERDATAPVVPRLSVEVDDVDAAYAEVLRRGAPVVYPLTDEPWGVRRFFVEDPDGTVVNVLGHRR